MKPIEYYVALAASMLFVLTQHKEKTWLSRSAIAGSSGGIGYATAPDVAMMVGRSEILAVVVITAFSYFLLDACGALLADREAIKEMVKRRLGGKT